MRETLDQGWKVTMARNWKVWMASNTFEGLGSDFKDFMGYMLKYMDRK